MKRFCQFQIYRSVHGWTFVGYSPEVLLNTATQPLKNDTLLLGWPNCRGYVGFREGISWI